MFQFTRANLIQTSKVTVLSALISVILIGCTADRELKSQAIDFAKSDIEQAIVDQLDSDFSRSHPYFKTYKDFIMAHTDFNIVEIQKEGEKSAFIKIEISSISPLFRSHLEKIISKLDEKQQLKFNMGEAINLIVQKTGASPNSKFERAYSATNAQDRWQFKSR